jgi:hypothetical protein
MITKIKGKKIIFSLEGLPPIGPGGFITILDAGVQIAKAKIKKVGKKKAFAIIYEGIGLVDKGYKVKVLVPGNVGKRTGIKKKKIKYNRGKKREKKEQSEEDEQEEVISTNYSFKILGCLSYLKMGEPINARDYDPTEFGSYIGYGLELNYKATQMFTLFAGIDYHFASGVTTIPANPKNLASDGQADGNISDIFLGSHIFLDEFDLPGVYFTLGYIAVSGHKLGTSENLIIRYAGSGLTFGGGYEIRTNGPWVYQFGIRFNRYGYTTYENNTEENETIDISQNTFGMIFRLGYQF